VRRAAYGWIGIALVATGCRQVFGIDDTEAVPDAASTTAVDGPITGLCAVPHLLCADFDTPATGIARFQPSVTADGTVQEQDSVVAVSPPRLLVAGVAAGATASQAAIIATTSATAARSRTTLWIEAPTQTTGCDASVVTLYLAPDPAMGYVALATVSGMFGLAVGVGGDQQTIAVGPIQPGFQQVTITVDTTAGQVITRAGSAAPVQLAHPGLAMSGALLLGAGFGIAVGDNHAACEVRFDDIIVNAQ
jgi:hypothetical protein